ncbi:hypothetical protein V8F44DRAFT_589673 [Aspergillus fumigatus]
MRYRSCRCVTSRLTIMYCLMAVTACLSSSNLRSSSMPFICMLPGGRSTHVLNKTLTIYISFIDILIGHCLLGYGEQACPRIR